MASKSVEWTQAEKYKLLLQIIDQRPTAGAAIRWAELNMPGRTVKSLQKMMEKIKKEVTDTYGANHSQDAPGSTDAKTARKRAISPLDDDFAEEQGNDAGPPAKVARGASGRFPGARPEDGPSIQDSDSARTPRSSARLRGIMPGPGLLTQDPESARTSRSSARPRPVISGPSRSTQDPEPAGTPFSSARLAPVITGARSSTQEPESAGISGSSARPGPAMSGACRTTQDPEPGRTSRSSARVRRRSGDPDDDFRPAGRATAPARTLRSSIRLRSDDYDGRPRKFMHKISTDDQAPAAENNAEGKAQDADRQSVGGGNIQEWVNNTVVPEILGADKYGAGPSDPTRGIASEPVPNDGGDDDDDDDADDEEEGVDDDNDDEEEEGVGDDNDAEDEEDDVGVSVPMSNAEMGELIVKASQKAALARQAEGTEDHDYDGEDEEDENQEEDENEDENENQEDENDDEEEDDENEGEGDGEEQGEDGEEEEDEDEGDGEPADDSENDSYTSNSCSDTDHYVPYHDGYKKGGGALILPDDSSDADSVASSKHKEPCRHQ